MTLPEHPEKMQRHPGGERPLPCEEIRDLMLDFVQRDLGEGRTDLVREHIRRCPGCTRRMAELQKTVGFLCDAPFAHGALPMHLSERHHSRLVRALMHPVLDWIYVHHILVSVLIAIVVVTTTFFSLRHYRILRDDPGPGIPVVIGEAPDE